VRFLKMIIVSALLFAIFPVMSASAMSGLYSPYTSTTFVVLAWQKDSNESNFWVYKDNALVAQTTNTSYQVTGLQACTNYFFTVSSGYNSQSISLKTAGCPDTNPPSAPTNLTYTSTETVINAAWNASYDNETWVSTYRIYRNGVYIGNTSNRSYSITGLQPGTAYTIGVRAVDSAGNVSAMTSRTMYTKAQVYSVTYTGTASGNISFEGGFYNSSPNNETLNLTLYRVTSSGDVYVGSTNVYINPYTGANGTYQLGYSQPYGSYKVVIKSAYNNSTWYASGSIVSN
jgi:hypothetical protein